MHLPDINFWLAIDIAAHQHHQSALAWFTQHLGEPLIFCRNTQQGYLRLLTNPAPRGAGGFAVNMAQAWQHYDQFLSNPSIRFEAEPIGIESVWRQYTQGKTFSPKLWNDAYLAAFVKQRDYNLVTFDQGFQNYPGLKLTLLP